jgi:hypothetical protein
METIVLFIILVVSYRLDKINIKYVDMTLLMSRPLLAKRVEVLDSLVGCDLGNICAKAGR